MSVLPVGFGAGASVAPSYTIPNSLRFRENNLASLSRAFGASNRQNWTWSGWVKRGNIDGAFHMLFGVFPSPGNGLLLAFDSSDRLEFQSFATSTINGRRISTTIHRDPSAWYHVHCVVNTTNPASTDRIRLYVNGVQIIAFTLALDFTLNFSTLWNSGTTHYMGQLGGASYLDGYLAAVHCLDGLVPGPEEFGEFNTDGVWVPKAYAGSYGANGFYLPFDNAASLATLTADASGNGNNWTANNISLTSGATYDSMVDTPTNNYPTLDSVNNLILTAPASLITAASLSAIGPTSGSAAGSIVFATQAADNGKYYFEYTIQSVNTFANIIMGMFDAGVSGAYSAANSFFVNANVTGSSGLNDSEIRKNGAVIQTVPAWAVNDVCGVAVDLTAGTAQFYRNNTPYGALVTGITAGPKKACLYTVRLSTGGRSGAAINFGQHPFVYTPPVGYSPMSSSTIPASVIVTSGSFTGNASANGPVVWMEGNPASLTINGNAVTFGTNCDKLAGGFKVRSASSSFNLSGTNNWAATAGKKFTNPNTAQVNP